MSRYVEHDELDEGTKDYLDGVAHEIGSDRPPGAVVRRIVREDLTEEDRHAVRDVVCAGHGDDASLLAAWGGLCESSKTVRRLDAVMCALRDHRGVDVSEDVVDELLRMH